MLSSWSDIGTSSMNGGAFNWGSLWSGVKSFGSSIKNWGNRAWNSSTGQALRQKLKDTNLRDKVVEGLASGIHGAVDLANQEIAKAIEKRLESRPTVQVEDPEVMSTVEDLIEEKPAPPPASATVETVVKKRPPDEEELVIRTEEPPRYEDIFPNNSAVPISLRPTAVRPPAPVVAAPAPAVTPVTTDIVVAPPRSSSRPTIAPARSTRGWQGTLNSIVGLGVRSVKRRRCF